MQVSSLQNRYRKVSIENLDDEKKNVTGANTNLITMKAPFLNSKNRV